MNNRGTETNGQKYKKLMTMYEALHWRDEKDYIGQEKKSKEDMLALRIALMHQNKDSRLY